MAATLTEQLKQSQQEMQKEIDRLQEQHAQDARKAHEQDHQVGQALKKVGELETLSKERLQTIERLK